MIVLALLGTGCGIVGAAIVLYAGGYFSGVHHSRARMALVSLISLYPLTFVSVFFSVALASAAGAHLDGRRLSVGEALAASRERLGRIALWSLLATTVGLIVSEVASRLPGGAKIAGWLMGSAWGLATIFAIPLLALEDAGPIEALRGSALLLKSRWGEGLAGVIGIGAWTVLATFPAVLTLGIGVALLHTQPATGVVLIAVGLVVMVTVVALASATRQVFAVALYRYAVGAPAGGFDAADLEHPFALREGRRRRTHWIAWVALGLIVAFVALGAVLGQRRRSVPRSGAEGYSYLVFQMNPQTEAEIRDGMPVLYRGRKVGFVVERRLEGSRVVAIVYVDPRSKAIVSPSTTMLDYAHPARPFLLIRSARAR